MWLMPFGQESSEERERMRRFRRRTSVPPNEVGAPVPLEPLVARSPDAAVVLERATVYSTGVVLHIRRVLRLEPDPMLQSPGFPGGDLLLGVTLPDGRTASTVRSFPPVAPDLDAGPDDPGLSMIQGSSSGTQSSHDFLLYPVPPDGPVTLVVASPEVGIAETTVILDGAALQDARARVQVLWARTDDDDLPRRPPPRRPDLPPGGWFERNAGPPG